MYNVSAYSAIFQSNEFCLLPLSLFRQLLRFFNHSELARSCDCCACTDGRAEKCRSATQAQSEESSATDARTDWQYPTLLERDQSKPNFGDFQNRLVLSSQDNHKFREAYRCHRPN